MPNANHQQLGSAVLHSSEIAAMSHKFAEGYARVRDVTDNDGACPAWAKALYMACAAAVRGCDGIRHHEMQRSHDLGLTLSDARGAALAVMISRGEEIYARFTAAVDATFGEKIGEPTDESPEFELDRQAALDYFESYFGFVPD
ncbi:MAG: hypothetical protein ACR2PK_14010, partial [Acidimicrobiales bacterium]